MYSREVRYEIRPSRSEFWRGFSASTQYPRQAWDGIYPSMVASVYRTVVKEFKGTINLKHLRRGH